MTFFTRWLWYLLLANPLVVRTVAGGSRRMRHQWVRMGYLGALVAMVTLGLMTGGGMSGALSLTDLAKAGTYVFAIVGYGQVILICLLSPLFMAGAIASEHSGRTYDILLTTPLSNMQIVLGSLLGRLFFVLALLISGLPLFAVLLIFGGVPINAVFVCFATSALLAILVGSVAVTLSVMRAGGRKAVFVFVISIAAYLVATYLADRFGLRPNTAVPNSTTWLTPLHPLLVVEASLHSAAYMPPDADALGAYPRLARWYLSRPFAAFATLTGVASIVLIVWSTLILRWMAQGQSGGGRLGRWLRLHGSGERRRAPRHVRGNPVAWREANTRGNRTSGILARWAFLLIGLGAAATALWYYHGRGISSKTFQTMLISLLLVETAVIVMVALYMSAGSVSSEREDGTLDLLLTTPITPRQYIWGKLRGLVGFLSLILAAPILTAALVAIYTLIGTVAQWNSAMVNSPILGLGGTGKVKHPLMLIETPLLLAMILIPFVALCIMVGLMWSLKSKRVLGAVVPALSLIGLLSVVTGFCGWHAAANVPFVGPVINAFSPATSMVMLVNPWEQIEDFAQPRGSGRVTLIMAALFAGGVYSAVVYTMLQTIVGRFDHTVRRLIGTG